VTAREEQAFAIIALIVVFLRVVDVTEAEILAAIRERETRRRRR
jgi:curli biogenesis system outer membrane secretion channel CsgG